MLTPGNKALQVSSNPHSLSVQGAVTTPSYDSYWIANQKKWNAAGMQGMGSLNMDGSGLFGTGLFGNDPSMWGIPEMMAGVLGIYAIYAMFFQAKQTKYRLEMAAGRRRKSKAAKLRAKAKSLEGQTEGLRFF